MNIFLADVWEDYTTLVPARDPAPPPQRAAEIEEGCAKSRESPTGRDMLTSEATSFESRHRPEPLGSRSRARNDNADGVPERGPRPESVGGEAEGDIRRSSDWPSDRAAGGTCETVRTRGMEYPMGADDGGNDIRGGRDIDVPKTVVDEGRDTGKDPVDSLCNVSPPAKISGETGVRAVGEDQDASVAPTGRDAKQEGREPQRVDGHGSTERGGTYLGVDRGVSGIRVGKKLSVDKSVAVVTGTRHSPSHGLNADSTKDDRYKSNVDTTLVSSSVDDDLGVEEGEIVPAEAERSVGAERPRTPKEDPRGSDAPSQPSAKPARGRRSRRKGPWRGELVPIRRQRFLKQLFIRGDNVVMVWEERRS